MTSLLVLFYVILEIYLAITSFSLTVRRLHDTGRSHWPATFVYISFLTPFLLIGLLALFKLDPNHFGFAFGGLGWGELFFIAGFIGMIYVLVLMFFKSQPGTNKWGDTPEKRFGFIDASRKFFINWLDFKSRSRRSEYWWASLTLFSISLVLELFLL